MRPEIDEGIYHLLTLMEAATCLGVSRRTLERMIAEGQFPPPVKIRRSSKVLRSDVQAYLTKAVRTRPRR
ncbi:MAG: helix-turn-helix domain-containing protein [Opitutaceae bacterium]|nr:helix-turn-helix domain-containing protein [Opitutaceae bacterium]